MRFIKPVILRRAKHTRECAERNLEQKCIPRTFLSPRSLYCRINSNVFFAHHPGADEERDERNGVRTAADWRGGEGR